MKHFFFFYIIVFTVQHIFIKLLLFNSLKYIRVNYIYLFKTTKKYYFVQKMLYFCQIVLLLSIQLIIDPRSTKKKNKRSIKPLIENLIDICFLLNDFNDLFYIIYKHDIQIFVYLKLKRFHFVFQQSRILSVHEIVHKKKCFGKHPYKMKSLVG